VRIRDSLTNQKQRRGRRLHRLKNESLIPEARPLNEADKSAGSQRESGLGPAKRRG